MPGRGRPRRYCRPGCRQQAHLARKLAVGHQLADGEVVVRREDLAEGDVLVRRAVDPQHVGRDEPRKQVLGLTEEVVGVEQGRQVPIESIVESEELLDQGISA